MIKIAIIGVGNCASSLLQGLRYYSNEPHAPGLITLDICGYGAEDIEVVAAFDVIADKVGRGLSYATTVPPNNTVQFSFPKGDGIQVSRGPTLDGLGQYLRTAVTESPEPPVNVPEVLQNTGAEIVINYLPVGSEIAARFYASAAIAAHCAFINCMPTFIASDQVWAARFAEAGLPVIGDDIKSQIGATIVHRALATLFRERGVKLERTYQLNVGGNADFYNMLERERLISKKISKTQAVTSIAGVELASDDVHIGPSDHVPWLADRKVAFIRLEGTAFGGVPLAAEVRLEVHDSPNSAGVVMDAIRCAKVALDRGEAGIIDAPSSWYMKSPRVQLDDAVAAAALQDWLYERY